MRLGIRGQLLVPLSVVTTAFLAVSLGAAWQSIRRERDTLQKHLDEIGHTLEQSRLPLTKNVLLQMKGLTAAEFCLHRAGHETICTMAEAPSASALGIGEPTAPTNDSLGRRVEWANTSYIARVHRPPSNNVDETTTLTILYPVQKWNDAITAAVLPVLTLGLAGTAVAVGIAAWFGGRLVGRIRLVEKHTRQVATGDFAPMTLPTAHDELRDLAASVNIMTDRLRDLQAALADAERWRLLGQMSGGLAHQLRNGVSGAKLALQLHMREHPADDSEPLVVALRQLAVVEVHIRRFLELGQSPQETPVVCSIVDVADEAIRLVGPRCQHLHVELTRRDSDDELNVTAVPDQLLQIMLNLIDNAIDACAPGGAVALNLKRHRDAIEFTVSDTGPGPPSGLDGRIFEPFVTGKRDGIGLGLAVVRRLVDAHHGTVRWTRDNGQTCFTVTLSATRSASPRPTSRSPELELA